MSIYSEIVKQNLPRLLNLYNTDAFSNSYGIGDREYWGWKTKDFANATYQGGVHTMAAAMKLDLLKNSKFYLRLIDSAITAIQKVQSKNGSVVEAYPNEHSFCVSALTAFDILSAIELLGSELTMEKRQQYLHVVEPLIAFITENNEEHAIISNHLATGAAAIVVWNGLAEESSKRADELLTIIYENQSGEGWYREYEGADPGYQTLCTYYLAAVYNRTRDPELLNSLNRSVEFLQYFIHPDGSIGGLYGSRNTEVYYPGGIAALSHYGELFKTILHRAELGYSRGAHILPQSIDAGNFIPLLNSYAFAMLAQNESIDESENELPQHENFEKKFSEAGLFIKGTPNYYFIMNYKKGGTLKVFDRKEKKLDYEDGGITATFKNGRKCSTQIYNDNISFNDSKLKSYFYYLNESHPNPINFIILRLLSITMFRSVKLGNIFKKFIVGLLMTGKKKAPGSVRLQFNFTDDKILINEKVTPPAKTVSFGRVGIHRAIHMASSGYFTPHRETDNRKSKFVKINAD